MTQLREGDPELLQGLKQVPLGQGAVPQPGMEGGPPPEGGGQPQAQGGSPDALAAGQAASFQPGPPGQAEIPVVPEELTAQGALPPGGAQ